MKMNELLEKSLNYIRDSRVKEALLYSLLAGGKRIRPKLLYDVLEGYGYDTSIADPFAVAIEMIHTYSLIHDDLPAMDNDDYRRGRLTCHKQFDEATAILAGDALLTEAFQLCTKASVQADKIVACISILADACGANGMVYGQNLDMHPTEEKSLKEIEEIHHYKTGSLLSAPLMIAAILANHKEDISIWQEIGICLGQAFQYQDDLFDVTLSQEQLGKSTSDVENEKSSVVSLLGIEKTEELMNQTYDRAELMIQGIQGFKNEALMDTVKALRKRQK
ncbi:MAG: polyprenyl synthetase family protein [Solobacterium sp.]|nr:polyprenyl synthetase family protein [Solobacterium sp.]